MTKLTLVLLAACAGAAAQPTPVIVVTNGKPGAFTIVANATTKLATLARIEAMRDGKWVDVSRGFDAGDGYRLIEACDPKPPTCFDMAAGAKRVPVPWSGMSCSSQCNGTCDKNGPLPAGDYRLVVTTCDGTIPFTGPTFRFDGKAR